MRLGIIGDTHGQVELAIKLLNQLKPLDLVLHTGDYYDDGALLGQAVDVEIHAVAGNWDPLGAGPKEKTLQLEGKKIYLTHGHQYQVQFTMQRIFYRALELGADVVIFGHTHVCYCQEHEGVLFFNPGAVYRPLRDHRPVCGLLVIEGHNVKPSFCYLNSISQCDL